MKVEEIKQHAKDAEIGWSAVKRAKYQLGIKAERVGGLGPSGWWIWKLPPDPSANAEEETVKAILASMQDVR